MPRPDDRPLHRLPSLEASKANLERCVFCPKLCRSACPVSNAEPRETLTPWGKMSMAYFAANASVEISGSFAAPAWACSGCFGCREHCDHKNDVTGTLLETRSALANEGVMPAGAARVVEREAERREAYAMRARTLARHPSVDVASSTVVLLGCGYLDGRTSDESMGLAIAAIAKLTGGKVALSETCCGSALLYAGAKTAFLEQGRALARHLQGKARLVVLDAGCASTIRVHLAATGVDLGVEVLHFTELAAQELGMLGRVPDLGADGPVRYHDPCQLGRGLGVYDAPRAILTRALGRAPDEFARSREDARCSGAGGLLPVTMPETSATMADQRLADHDAQGGGTVVTACASSFRRFQKQGARTLDLLTILARSLGIEPS